MNIICCENSEHLAIKVADALGFDCCKADVERYSCGEICVRANGCDSDVIVIANTKDHESWIELFLLLNALRDAKSIILCISYLGYSRHDKDIARVSKGDEVFVTFLENFKNIISCIFVDCHSLPKIRIPFQHLSAETLFSNDIRKNYSDDLAKNEIVIVSPDEGRRGQAISLAENLGCQALIGKKTRDANGKVNQLIINGEVKGKRCILFDDIVDSGSSLCHAANVLMRAGAKDVSAFVSHGVLSGFAVGDLENSVLTRIVLTDSILRHEALPEKFEDLSLASLIVDAIRCIL